VAVVDVVLDVPQQVAVAVDLHLGVAELALVGALYLAAELLRHGLHAVADAEHRHPQLEHQARCPGGAVAGGHRLGATGEDDAPGLEFADRLQRHIERVDLAVDTDLADAPGDQLGVLGAEVEDQDLVGVDIVAHGVFWLPVDGWFVTVKKNGALEPRRLSFLSTAWRPNLTPDS